MRLAISIGVVAMAGLASACATPSPQAVAASLQPIELAAAEDAIALIAAAESGDANAQFAMALRFTYGLRGVAADAAEAANWRGRATAQRGFTPITTYIAGLNGNPGRVQIINIARYDLSAGQAAAIDGCASQLAEGIAPAVSPLCGDVENQRRLAALWSAAKR